LNKKIPITIKGPVKKFVDISPKYISFRGNIGSPMERKLTITPLKEYPFKIKSIKAKNKKELDIDWREIKTETGVKYEILARNTRTESGRIKNYSKIKTDSKVKPELKINVGGYLQDPVKPKTQKQDPHNH